MTTVVTTGLSKTKHGRYQRLKKKLLGKYKTLSAAAAAVGCHPNAFREVCNGKCPRVRDTLIGVGILPASKKGKEGVTA